QKHGCCHPYHFSASAKVQIRKEAAEQQRGHEQVVHGGKPGDVFHVNRMQSKENGSQGASPATAGQLAGCYKDEIGSQNVKRQHGKVPSRWMQAKNGEVETHP